MKIEGEDLFDGPQEEVWKIVRDPEVLATALPGTKSLDKVGENEYAGEMNVRIGPVAGLFSGRLVISQEVPPESCTLTVEGRGGPGFMSGTGDVTLIDQGDGTTLLKYEGEVQIGGRLASVGQRLLDTASKSLIRQGLEALNVALQARLAAASEGEEVDYVPPSESAFAAAVAKDMAGEVLSSSRLVWIVIAALVILAIILAIWISAGSGG
ncbi:MAG: carbon monoxide dehydrogenase subunit G [Anaerolineales bacterium]